MNFDLEEEVPPPRLLNEAEESKAEGIHTRHGDHLTQRLRTPDGTCRTLQEKEISTQWRQQLCPNT